VLLAVSVAAHADLYRWVDPATGSVTFSNLPPTDARVSAEVVPYRGGAMPPKPPAANVQALQAEFNALYAQLASVEPQSYRNAGEALRRQMHSYEALRAELDRLDPAGASRRAAASLKLAEHLHQGLATGK
jgi:hypothetical protein